MSPDALAELDRLTREQKFSTDLLSSDVQLVADAARIVILFHKTRRGLECPGYRLALESLYYQMLKYGFVEPRT